MNATAEMTGLTTAMEAANADTFTCPVCAYDALIRPPCDYMICPCCGTEFGYDDFSATHEELCAEWLAKGAPWFSKKTPPPPGWEPKAQLQRAAMQDAASNNFASARTASVSEIDRRAAG